MINIPSFLMPYSTGGVSSAAQLSGDQLLLDQLNTQQNQNTSSNVFGDAVSLNLSDTALSMLGSGNGNSNDPTTGILNALTYSNFSTTSSGGSGNLDALLGSLDNTDANTANPQNPTTAFEPIATNSTSFAEAALADGGPLPAFLALVDTQMHLDKTQQQALQNIATEYQNASDTPDTVSSIAYALQQAGI